MKETLTDWLNARNNFGIFYPPMKAEEFVEFIKDYLLNENWYTVNPVSNEQVYTEILINVLDRYSMKYKKEMSTDIDYETISLRKRGKSIIKIGNARLGGTDVKIEVSTKFNWLQKKLWKYLLNIEIEDIKEDE
jgi:hypothetical protein